MHLVTQFYADNADFFDPVIAIQGASDIEKYYRGLYENVEEIKFEFSEFIETTGLVAAPWIMHVQAKNLNKGQKVSVAGISHIQFDTNTDKVVYHRDYFDMGAFVYEHVPILGMAIRYIKRQMHKIE